MKPIGPNPKNIHRDISLSAKIKKRCRKHRWLHYHRCGTDVRYSDDPMSTACGKTTKYRLFRGPAIVSDISQVTCPRCLKALKELEESEDICGLCGEPGADKFAHTMHWPGEQCPDGELVHSECETEECKRAHAALSTEQRKAFLQTIR